MTPIDEKRRSLARGEGLPEPLLLEDPMEALPPTAQRILAAAQRLLADGGFEALRLSAIAREAGESKASIGYHFGNKSGLVTALVDSLAHDSNRGLIEETAVVPAGEARATATSGQGRAARSGSRRPARAQARSQIWPTREPPPSPRRRTPRR